MAKVYHAVSQHVTQLPLFVLSKVCTKCDEEKPLEDFEFRLDTSRYRTQCRTCTNAKSAVRKKRYRQKLASLKPIPVPLPPGLKICPRCQQPLPFAKFGRNKSKGDGLQSYCSLCRSLYEQKFKEEKREYGLQYRQKHQEKLSEQRKQYYQEHKDEINARINQFRQEHPEIVQEWKKREYETHKDEYNKRSVIYQREHKDAHYRDVKRYQQTQKGKLVRRKSGGKRRARMRDTAVDSVDYQTIIGRDGCFCYICEQDIDPSLGGMELAGLTFDHEKPLAGIGERKGTHTLENIHPAHRVCNIRKGVKLLSEMTPFQRRGPNC